MWTVNRFTHGTVDASGGQCRGELGPVLPAPAFHLDERGRDRAAGAGDMGLDGRALRLQTKPATLLLVGADAVVGDETGRGGHAG